MIDKYRKGREMKRMQKRKIDYLNVIYFINVLIYILPIQCIIRFLIHWQIDPPFKKDFQCRFNLQLFDYH